MSASDTTSTAVRISGLVAEKKWARMRIDDVNSKLSKRRRLARDLQEEKRNLEAHEKELDMQLVEQGTVACEFSSLPWIIDCSRETPLIDRDAAINKLMRIHFDLFTNRDLKTSRLTIPVIVGASDQFEDFKDFALKYLDYARRRIPRDDYRKEWKAELDKARNLYVDLDIYDDYEGIERHFADALRKAIGKALKNSKTVPWSAPLAELLDFAVAAMGPTVVIVDARVGRYRTVADPKYSLPLIEKVWIPILRRSGLYLIIFGRDRVMEPYGRTNYDVAEFPNVNVARIHLNRPRSDMVEQIIRNTYFVNGDKRLMPFRERLEELQITVDRCRDYFSIVNGTCYVTLLSRICRYDLGQREWRNVDNFPKPYVAPFDTDPYGAMDLFWKYPDECREIYDASRDGSIINLNRVDKDGRVRMEYLASKLGCVYDVENLENGRIEVALMSACIEMAILPFDKMVCRILKQRRYDPKCAFLIKWFQTYIEEQHLPWGVAAKGYIPADSVVYNLRGLNARDEWRLVELEKCLGSSMNDLSLIIEPYMERKQSRMWLKNWEDCRRWSTSQTKCELEGLLISRHHGDRSVLVGIAKLHKSDVKESAEILKRNMTQMMRGESIPRNCVKFFIVPRTVPPPQGTTGDSWVETFGRSEILFLDWSSEVKIRKFFTTFLGRSSLIDKIVASVTRRDNTD